MTPSSDVRTVLLTGANEGIGYHMLTALADDGYRVAALDTAGDNLRENHTANRVRFYECDVTDAVDIEGVVTDVIDRWGRVDILVNNAAVSTFAPFEKQPNADTRRAFEVNFFGYLRMIRAVLPHMRTRGGGIIHNVGSATGDVGHPGLTGYAATKGAINGLTRSLQLELRGTGVSCTLMIPPTTDTRMAAELGYPGWMRADPEAVGRKLASKIESTGPVITPDWQTSLGLFFVRRTPGVWAKMTERYVDFDG